MSKMNDKQAILIKNSEVGLTNFRKLNNAGEKFLTESGVYKLVFKSRKPNAEKFTDWISDEVLPQIRNTGIYSTRDTNSSKISLKEQVESLEVVANMLRMNDASKLLMLENFYKDYNIPTGFLPKYEYNGNREMKAVSHLLKENDCDLSSKKFNILLIEHGYLEEKERASSKGEKKKFKALTEKGLQYGENAVNSHNQKEVQPLYYSDKFMELYNEIKSKEARTIELL